MPYCTQLAIACVGLGERSCKVLSIGVASLGPQQVVCGCSLQASGSDAVGKGLPVNRQALLAHGKKNAATSDLVACAFRVSLTSLKSLKRSGVKVFCYLLRDPALHFTQGFFVLSCATPWITAGLNSDWLCGHAAVRMISR